MAGVLDLLAWLPVLGGKSETLAESSADSWLVCSVSLNALRLDSGGLVSVLAISSGLCRIVLRQAGLADQALGSKLIQVVLIGQLKNDQFC